MTNNFTHPAPMHLDLYVQQCFLKECNETTPGYVYLGIRRYIETSFLAKAKRSVLEAWTRSMISPRVHDAKRLLKPESFKYE